MVLPLADDNTGRIRTPYVNYALLAINIFVFVVFQGMGQNAEFTYKFSTVPREIITGEDFVTPPREITDDLTGQTYTIPGLQPTPIPVWLTILTSMFMHGGFMHLAGNMLYLWIFGDNVEDDIGHVRYLVFYLLCGVIASLSHVFTNTVGENALIPSLGASGAIAGVLGAYLIQHPKRQIQVLLFRFIVPMPAFIVVGMWFVLQVITGATTEGDGVAYGAHIGGFIAGFVLIKPFLYGTTPPDDYKPSRSDGRPSHHPYEDPWRR